MAADKVTDALVEALRQALAAGTEQRLFKSGKLDGLFPGRTGANAEAATRALRDGLLEGTRTETRGKATIEWVKLTPRGVDFLHEHESPARALDELRTALRTVRDSVPAWQADLRRDLDALAGRLTEDSQQLVQKLEALTRRVESVLKRMEDERPQLSDGLAAVVPWGRDGLGYLQRRRGSGAPGDCPLPELFQAVTGQHPDLSIAAFHEGLRRLHEEKVLKLVPFDPASATLPQPEFALLDRGLLFYHVAR
jgi:hypothetical protein